MSSNIQQDYIDRRALPRHSTRDSSALMLSPDDIISFKLLDISKSGLAFCYNSIGLKSKLKDKAVISFFDEQKRAFDIPVTIISDVEIDKKDVWYTREDDGAEIPYLRRCGVEFDGISAEQEEAIAAYIERMISTAN